MWRKRLPLFARIPREQQANRDFDLASRRAGLRAKDGLPSETLAGIAGRVGPPTSFGLRRLKFALSKGGLSVGRPTLNWPLGAVEKGPSQNGQSAWRVAKSGRATSDFAVLGDKQRSVAVCLP